MTAKQTTALAHSTPPQNQYAVPPTKSTNSSLALYSFMPWKLVDVTRTSGSNGKVNSQSHKNLFYVFHTDDALIPHRAGACLIIPRDKHYAVVYRKRNPKEGETTIAITQYAPPQPGGAFSLHGNAVDYSPIIAEFTYVNTTTQVWVCPWAAKVIWKQAFIRHHHTGHCIKQSRLLQKAAENRLSLLSLRWLFLLG